MLQLSMCEEFLFGYSCRRWCSVCGSLQSCSVCEGKWRRERRGVCSGQRPPAAINHGDSRSTAHEALRPTPASLGGGSYTGLEIHPSPPPLATCQPLHSLEQGEIKKRRGGGKRRRRKKPVSTTGPYNTVFIASGPPHMRSQVMCQLGSNMACFTIDRAEHIAHATVRLLQDVITSLLSAMCHKTSGCMAQYAPMVMLLYAAYLGP